MEELHAPSYPDEETRLRHERAWAAGFFDGEGWAAAVGQRGRRTRQPCARINQSSTTGVPEALVRFRGAVEGIGSVRGPVIKEGREPLYRWTASSRGGVGRAYELLRPWLSAPKLMEFERALSPTANFGEAEAVPFRRAIGTEELAWAAGLFDGEGSTSLERHQTHEGYFVIESSVTQSSNTGVPEVLSRFQGALGGVGKIYGPYEQDGARELVYRWKAYGLQRVELLVSQLLPWLGAIKRAQAETSLSVVRSQSTLPRGNPLWGAYKTHCVHGHEYATARIRPYKSRRGGKQRRDSKQCLMCTREQARARRGAQREVGDVQNYFFSK